MEEEKNENKETEQDTEKLTDENSDTADEEAKTSQGSDLTSIKDAYEAKIKRMEEDAEQAKAKYESDLAVRNKMIADLIGGEQSGPVPDVFKKISEARAKNKRY